MRPLLSASAQADDRTRAVSVELRRPLFPRHARQSPAVIVAIFNVYLVILFILVKMKIVPFNLFWKCSPLIVPLLLMFGLFIPMGWGAPQGPALVVRNSVAVVPDIAGEVTDVTGAGEPATQGRRCAFQDRPHALSVST
jgi:hypothetical protein